MCAARKITTMNDYYKFVDMFNEYMPQAISRLTRPKPAIQHVETLSRLGDIFPDDTVVKRLGTRGGRAVADMRNTHRHTLQALMDKLPTAGGRLTEPYSFHKSELTDLRKSLDRIGNSAKDIAEEHFAEKVGDVTDRLRIRGLGYGLSGLGGGALGALIAGKGNRLLGGGIGIAAGLLANYLRRKSYYGKTIKW